MNQKTKSFLADYLPILLLAPLIIVSGLLAKQAVIKIIPAVGTLFIVLLSSKLYRVAFLLGAANCVLYSVGFFADGLYGSLVSTLLVSAPLQIASFFLWKRRAYKQATVFRVMKPGWYPPLIIMLAALWWGMLKYGSKWLALLNKDKVSDMISLDSLLFALGLVVTVLLMFAFVEGYALNLVSCVLSCVMWGVLMARDMSNVTYLLISLYTTYRISIALVKSINMYRAQRAQAKEAAA